MEENENNQLSKELEFERQKNKYFKKELEQKEKKLQITASIIVGYRGRSKLTNLFIKRCFVPGESFLDFLGMSPE